MTAEQQMAPAQAGDNPDAGSVAEAQAQAQAQEVARRSAEAMWADDQASRALGMELLEVAPGRARLRMTIRADMVNGHGIGHGGFTFLLADSTFAFACNSRNMAAVAAGCDIAFTGPVRLGDVLTAEGVEIWREGRNGITDVVVRNQDGVVVAQFRGKSRTLGTPLY